MIPPKDALRNMRFDLLLAAFLLGLIVGRIWAGVMNG